VKPIPIPIPILIVIYILAHSYGFTTAMPSSSPSLTIAFVFLLQPGEYTGTTADDIPLRLQDMGLYIGKRQVNILK
jgi:hypothetical protein